MVRQLSSCNTLGLREIQIVYEVRFNPEVDSKLALSKYINQHRWVIGNAETFAGVKLFLPIRYLEGIFFSSANYSASKTTWMIILVGILFKNDPSFAVAAASPSPKL